MLISPSAGRASTGFIYIIRRRGRFLIYISIYIFLDIYVYEWIFIGGWIQAQSLPHIPQLTDKQSWRGLALGMSPPHHIPIGDLLTLIAAR